MWIRLPAYLIRQIANLRWQAERHLLHRGLLEVVEDVALFELLVNLLVQILYEKVAPVNENQDSQKSLETLFHFGITKAV